MNIVKMAGSRAEQMFQYAFYLRLLQSHPDALLHAANPAIDVPASQIATTRQLQPWGVGSVKGRLLGALGGRKGTIHRQAPDEAYSAKIFDETNVYYEVAGSMSAILPLWPLLCARILLQEPLHHRPAIARW